MNNPYVPLLVLMGIAMVLAQPVPANLVHAFRQHPGKLELTPAVQIVRSTIEEPRDVVAVGIDAAGGVTDG